MAQCNLVKKASVIRARISDWAVASPTVATNDMKLLARLGVTDILPALVVRRTFERCTTSDKHDVRWFVSRKHAGILCVAGVLAGTLVVTKAHPVVEQMLHTKGFVTCVCAHVACVGLGTVLVTDTWMIWFMTNFRWLLETGAL